MVIPAQHGKATQVVNNSLKRIVEVMVSVGFGVLCLSAWTVSAPTLPLPTLLMLTFVMGGCIFRLPIQQQARVRAGICVPGYASGRMLRYRPPTKKCPLRLRER
jgi:hypothetical protein